MSSKSKKSANENAVDKKFRADTSVPLGGEKPISQGDKESDSEKIIDEKTLEKQNQLRDTAFLRYALQYWASWKMNQILGSHFDRHFISFLKTGELDRDAIDRSLEAIRCYAGTARETREKIELFISKFK